MRLVVLDTNVIVSAGINGSGSPARLVMNWVLEARVQMVTCSWIIGEYRLVARREKFRRYGFPPDWLEFLIEQSLQLPDPPSWQHRLPDPKDAIFLALAQATGAWLVTGNMKHFPKRFRNGVTVIAPAEYLTRLEDGE